MLLIIKQVWNAQTVADVDNVVCAEISDREGEPEAYEAVTMYMMHIKCGADDPQSPCIRDERCANRFSKQIRESTSMETDSYQWYRRRNRTIRIVEINGRVYSDEWFVPTNLYLLMKFNCHVNVKICGTISAVKYLYKYIYKGSDRARITIESDSDGSGNQVVDEIKQHLSTRYVCSPQALHKVFGYAMQEKSHTVCRLVVHLTVYQTVHFIAK
ncbi:hypothetical protein RB195_024415 [Necator americanus]|uniref:Helitron helicase n=1 Tax=Necator americanus TaxID=51031 RepID=A0ABR1EN33_NECAM